MPTGNKRVSTAHSVAICNKMIPLIFSLRKNNPRNLTTGKTVFKNILQISKSVKNIQLCTPNNILQ